MSNRDGGAFPLSSNCKRTAGFLPACVCLIMLALPGRSQAQIVTDIYDFVEGVQGYGNYPGAPLIVGPKGVLYGTTDEGGNLNSDHQRGFGCGTTAIDSSSSRRRIVPRVKPRVRSNATSRVRSRIDMAIVLAQTRSVVKTTAP